MFKQAERTQLWLRLALIGASGSGKSFSALKILSYMIQDKPIVAIDTEKASLRRYAPAPGETPDPEQGAFNFLTAELDNYNPKKYIEAINAAVKMGAGALLIDSMTHAWAGKGGVLDMKQQMDKRGGNGYTNWQEAGQWQTELVETITSAPLHIIATFRSKQEYVLEVNDKGKSVPRKMGLAPVQRDDVEYEFDIVGMMGNDNNLTITKSRCQDLQLDQVIEHPGRNLAEILVPWLNAGAKLPLTKSQFVEAMLTRGYTIDDQKLFVGQHDELQGLTRWDDLLALARVK